MHTKKLVSVMVVTTCVILALGKTARALPVPREIKSAVVYIGIKNIDGNVVPYGTGFLVGVKNPSEPGSLTTYLVTAKHVITNPKTSELLGAVFFRLNRKGGGLAHLTIPLTEKGEGRNVFTHSDSSVDIAVIPYTPNAEMLDFKTIPAELITTKDALSKLQIHEGSDVFFAGLFAQYLGAERNYPIVRFGRVALVTDEKIGWNGKQMDLYLIEASSYGGNSGAPVFFYLGSDRNPGAPVAANPIICLAGVMQGMIQDRQPVQGDDTQKGAVSVSNMGIAAVVPAYKLYEVLYGDELKKQRGF